MSKQFYSYLTDKLISFLNSDNIKSGDRFYIQLDEKDQVEEFYNVLRDSELAEIFSYKHDKGSEYESFYMDINGVKLVIASTFNVTPGYLVTVRNASKVQLDVWKNTALLIICDQPLDSIKGGCLDLRQDGMPFSVKSISGNLVNEIDNSKLSKSDREIIKFYMNKKLDSSYNSSLWDYEEILGIMNKQVIEKEDYKNMELFKDSSLENETVRTMKKRLEENYNLYAKVESYQDYEDKEKYLEKLFDDKGVDKLKKDNWRDLDFKKVKESLEKNKSNAPLGYIENIEKHIDNENVYWERAKADNASGKRKRHIIVFNQEDLGVIELNFKFDETLFNEYIEANSKRYTKASGKKLIVRLPSNNSKECFYKIVYNHKNESKSKYEFFIAVLNIKPEALDNIKTKYEVKTGSGSKNRVQINSDGTEMKFGQGFNENSIDVDRIDQVIEVNDDECIKISTSSAAWDDASLKAKLSFNGTIVPIEIKEQGLRSKPINSINIRKRLREFNENFTWDENKITQANDEFYLDEKLKVTLKKERAIIEKRIMFGNESLNQIEKVEVEYGEELTKAYNDILDYYNCINNIPSLTYLDDEIIELYEKYLNIYNSEIESIESGEIISSTKYKKNLLKLGCIVSENTIKFSPFSPLNISYNLEMYRQLQNDVVEVNILECLRTDNLLPYIYNDKDEVYKPVYQNDNVQWITFENKEQVSVGETNAFVAKVVREKINQFINNFSYLFSKKVSAPIKINVINIKNDIEVIKGVFEFIKKQIENNQSRIIPIDVTIYNDGDISAFDTFFELSTIEHIEEEFNISFTSKNNQLDESDVMRLTLENIRYFKKSDEDYGYAHISFYKSKDNEESVEASVKSIESGISIGGLLSSVTSNNNEDDYRLGFGTKNIIEESNILIRTVINMNQFATNCNKSGANPYKKGNSIVTRHVVLEEAIKSKLYTSSHWVTFIEPSFGLEYFKDSSNSELVVIHYSDQYSSTDQYDTITVTNKSAQYKYIIQDFLRKKDIEITDNKMNDVIRSFNSINGDWLLNLTANKGEYDREKLSIISAVKYVLSLINHEDIIWIPISLEEVLRISSAVKLNKSEGIFSIKNLKKHGVHSDDLIFIGVNIKDAENIKLYYYPVEVKIGYNFASVIDKGSKQLENTYKLLKEQLTQYEEGGRKIFKNKFFRNFFIKLLISNAQKLIINNMWPEKQIERLYEIKKYLLNDEYSVDFTLDQYIGKGALISFKKDNYWRSAKQENQILVIELTEDDAYQGVSKTVNEIYESFKNGHNDIDLNTLIYNKSIYGLPVHKEICEDIKESEEVVLVGPAHGVNTNNYVEKSKKDKEIHGIEEKLVDNSLNHIKESNNNIRVLLGQAEGSTKNIYWEYGNKELANRHMVITGKSGNGKTYFIQCALKEVIDSGVPAIIIDYTDGFKSSQLEPAFKEHLGDNLKQFIVRANQFPLNIFKRGVKELDDDIFIDEDYFDVAERFKSVIGAVYKDLGIQQLNSIYQTVINGLDKYEGKLNLKTFRHELEENSSSNAQTALSQLSVLLDKNPFDESQHFDWSDLNENSGKLFIIQLTGYTKEIQKIITEMILWDLYMYKSQHGRKDKPFVVVLDEAQNLNFGDNSPSTKILTEGRKFGWSAWFATQFLKGQMDKATISRLQNSAQKIYFAQTEEEAVSVANNFGETTDEKKAWTKTLINLEKGSCISYGPIDNGEGKLVPSKPIKIKIISLEGRSNK